MNPEQKNENGLLPVDQHREDLINDLFKVVCDPHKLEFERRGAFELAARLISMRPEYVVKMMEKEQGLS